MSEEEVSETARSYALSEPPKRIEVADLPLSPKKVYLAAERLGWEVHAWLTTGLFGPSFYVSNSDEGAKKTYNKGDVFSQGYSARMFVVEARDLAMPLGFQAFFTGKTYDTDRASSGGSFEYARVVDPVGLPVVSTVQYKPIKQKRGDYETDKSFAERLALSKAAAGRMTDEYNDGSIHMAPQFTFNASKQFDSWLAEWDSYINPKGATLA